MFPILFFWWYISSPVLIVAGIYLWLFPVAPQERHSRFYRLSKDLREKIECRVFTKPM